MGPYTVAFTAGDSSSTLLVSTVGDNIAELLEYFKVMIVSTTDSRVIVGSPDTSYVTISDNDGEIYVVHMYYSGTSK